jgi:protein-S-isoprenylcysteine O-methyltransferase Ste14
VGAGDLGNARQPLLFVRGPHPIRARQHVVSDGPYRFVRHPGYTAALVIILANGLALGSWLAAAISWIGIPILLRRTVKEDRMLHAALPGYAEYAARTKWRLLPGVW